MAMYTGSINRVTGLSGVDTESMIDKMMKAESGRLENLERKKTKVTWQQEVYRELISSMQGFQDKWFSNTNPTTNLGFEGTWNNYLTKVTEASGKESSAISIKSSVQTGKYELEVTQVAQAESLTGIAKTSGEITTGSSLDEIYNSIEKAGEVNFKFNLDGTNKDIKITADDLKNATNGTTNAEKVKNLFNDKLNTAFGTGKINVADKGGKLVFSAKATSSLTISDGENTTKDTSMTHTGLLDPAKEGDFELKLKFGGKDYTIKTKFEKDDSADKRINKIVEAFKSADDGSGTTTDISKKLSIKISKTGTDNKDLKIETLSNTDEYEVTTTFTDTTSVAGATPDTQNMKLNSLSNLDKLGIEPGKVSTSVTENTRLTQALGDDYKTFFNNNKDADGVVKLNFGGKEISLTENDTIYTLSQKVKSSDSDVTLGFNQVTGRFKLEASKSGADNSINITDQKTKDFLKELGLDVDNKSSNDFHIQGQNAKFVIDGITVERPSNEVNMNGLQFNINGVTNGKVTIESKSNEEDTMNKIKSFVEDYNKLIESIESNVKQKREKSGDYGYYEPLLDSEKKDMSEDEIKKWEEKAKTGLLYQDELLTGLLSKLREIPYQRVNIGGKELSLSDLGIGHSKDYNSGKLEIDETKLKKAITEHGADIGKLFTESKTGIADRFKSTIDSAIGSRGSLRNKAGIKNTASVANNLLSKELDNISKRLAAEKERLYNKEMQYFKMFSKMESAMSKQNAQMGMLSSLLGQS